MKYNADIVIIDTGFSQNNKRKTECSIDGLTFSRCCVIKCKAGFEPDIIVTL